MKRGKQTCRILKEIRKQIAEANEIEFIVSECQYQGDCLGTCPKCEAEVRYLEQQLEYKRIAGKAITILGISAGIIAMAAPLSACANTTSQQDSIAPIQKEKEKNAAELIFGLSEGEEYPSYPGGQKELMEFIEKNVRYPSPSINIAGRVIVHFTINKDGSATDFTIARGLHPLFDKEALRVVSCMKKWNPGKQNGKPVRVKFTVPVRFNGNNTRIKQTQIIETRADLKEDSIIIVRGRIINKEGNPIVEAKIGDAENQKSRTTSDRYGCFEFKISNNHDLTVSSIGMRIQRINIKKYRAPFINIVLLEEDKTPVEDALIFR